MKEKASALSTISIVLGVIGYLITENARTNWVNTTGVVMLFSSWGLLIIAAVWHFINIGKVGQMKKQISDYEDVVVEQITNIE